MILKSHDEKVEYEFAINHMSTWVDAFTLWRPEISNPIATTTYPRFPPYALRSLLPFTSEIKHPFSIVSLNTSIVTAYVAERYTILTQTQT
jgi:hypothetical protein